MVEYVQKDLIVAICESLNEIGKWEFDLNDLKTGYGLSIKDKLETVCIRGARAKVIFNVAVHMGSWETLFQSDRFKQWYRDFHYGSASIQTSICYTMRAEAPEKWSEISASDFKRLRENLAYLVKRVNEDEARIAKDTEIIGNLYIEGAKNHYENAKELGYIT